MPSYQRARKEILLWSGVTRANRSTSPQPDDDHDYYWIWWSWWWWWQWWNYGGKQQENDDWMIITIPPHLTSWSSLWSLSWKASPWGDEDRYSKKTGNHHSERTCTASLEMMIIVMTITMIMIMMIMMIMIYLLAQRQRSQAHQPFGGQTWYLEGEECWWFQIIMMIKMVFMIIMIMIIICSTHLAIWIHGDQ